MHPILKVAQREYVETAKTKAFLLSIVMAPVIIGGIIFFTNRISRDKVGPRPPITVAVTDFSGKLGDEIKTVFDQYNESNPKRQFLLQKIGPQQGSAKIEKQGKNKLRRGQVDAYVILGQDVLSSSDKIDIKFYTHKPKPANLDALRSVEGFINNAVVNHRCKSLNLSPKVLAELRNVRIQRLELGSADNQ